MSKEEYTYKEAGSKAVILFHAYTSTSNDVTSLARALERENYTVMTPTFAGHGAEDPNVILDYGIDDWLENGEEAIQTLKDDGYTDISVFGLSLGGIIATHLMLNEDVNSYGIFSSPVITNEDSNVPENFWSWYQYKMKKMGVSSEEVKQKKPEVMEQVTKRLKEINDYVETMIPKYSEVTLPVFIGQGGQDEMINAEHTKIFRDKLENAEVDFHWYDEAPHVITIGRVGKQLQKDLLAFLEENA